MNGPEGPHSLRTPGFGTYHWLTSRNE